MDNTPLVSVCMITYSHEKYIEEAIKGVLMQETNFDVELIISNDNSPDQTDVIIQRILKEHPKAHWIKYIKHEQNLGASLNAIDSLQQCAGKYIACCEGDDYWTDPNKLQKQVDFLETNSDYAICFHNVQVWEKGNLNDDYFKKIPGDISTIIDLAKGNYIHSVSCLIRNYFANGLPDFFNSSPVGDYPILMMAAQNGKIKYLDQNMAVYRLHDGGMWTSKSSIEKLEASALAIKFLIDHFDGEVKYILQDQYIAILGNIIREYKNKPNPIGNPYFIRENASINVIFKALLAKIQMDYLKIK